MKPFALILAAVAVATSMAACSKKEAATTEAVAPLPPSAAAPTALSSDMAAMPMGAEAKMAKSTGTVTAVSADSITIDHAPIPEVNWPAMTMGFKASPALAKSVKVGDKVGFDVTLQGGGGEITAISHR